MPRPEHGVHMPGGVRGQGVDEDQLGPVVLRTVPPIAWWCRRSRARLPPRRHVPGQLEHLERLEANYLSVHRGGPLGVNLNHDVAALGQLKLIDGPAEPPLEQPGLAHRCPQSIRPTRVERRSQEPSRTPPRLRRRRLVEPPSSSPCLGERNAAPRGALHAQRWPCGRADLSTSDSAGSRNRG